MSVGDLSGLTSKRQSAQLPDSQVRGRVTQAPAHFTDDMIVTPEDSSQVWPFEVRHGRWWPHPDGSLPLQGDPCLVMIDHKTGEPWVLVGTL